jgi:hypothetical protein
MNVQFKKDIASGFFLQFYPHAFFHIHALFFSRYNVNVKPKNMVQKKNILNFI